MNSKGWNSQAHREFPGIFESTNLGRDSLSREIGRTALHDVRAMLGCIELCYVMLQYTILCYILVGIARDPLFRGPFIISLCVLIWPYLAKCLYKLGVPLVSGAGPCPPGARRCSRAGIPGVPRRRGVQLCSSQGPPVGAGRRHGVYYKRL